MDIKKRNHWGICCPGPSLALYQIQKKISLDNPDYLVAVNGAILLTDFNFDYWVLQDIEVFENVLGKVDEIKLHTLYSTWLCVPRRWLDDIPAYHDRLNHHFQSFLKETLPLNSVEEFNAIMPFGKHIDWRHYTVFVAIALAILNGAQEINIYGADMDGKGYFINGLENERTQHDIKRWENERYRFKEIVKACKEQGILIT